MIVRFYGRLADAIGREAQVDVAKDSSIDHLRVLLATEYPAAAATLNRARACIDGILVEGTQSLAGSDSVEFLPPVCGG